jgi:hypothetical protein
MSVADIVTVLVIAFLFVGVLALVIESAIYRGPKGIVLDFEMSVNDDYEPSPSP